jgi:hypothetical protein
MAQLSKAGWTNGLLFVEAALALTLSSIAIAVLPFARLARWLSQGDLRAVCGTNDAQTAIRRGRWAVEAAARRLPWKTVCFQKGLAYHLMMRRRGIPTVLHYGVGRDLEEGLRAHVWVSHAGIPCIGGEVAAEFVCLATYPPEPQLQGGGGAR